MILVLEVNEEGTTAAAVTCESDEEEEEPPEPFTRKVNRPFLFIISDKRQGNLLFAAKIEKPQ